MGTQNTMTTAYLLVDGFSMMAFMAATEPLRIANRLTGTALYRRWLLSEQGTPVTASNSLRVLPDAALADMTYVPWLAVCSGFLDQSPPSAALRHWLHRLDEHGSTLGGIDTGCFLLAQAGLLDGHTVTLHWESLPAFRERFPVIEAVESLYEVGNRRFSCAGGMAATDMALADIADRHGTALARAVAEQLIHDRARDPDAAQRQSIVKRLAIHNASLVEAVALMEKHHETPLSMTDIATRVKRSERQLQRLFETELGTSPTDWYRGARLDHARTLVAETERSLSEIAAATGFASLATFSRAFKARFDMPPSRLRA